MKFEIANNKIAGAINLLAQLSLKGKQSRHRSKLIKELNTRFEEVVEDEKALLKQHCHLDAEGEPKKTNEDRNWDVKDEEAFAADRKELLEEKLVLEGGNITGYLKTMRDVLLNCEVEWSGTDAAIYDYLCDELEKENEMETEEKSA